MRPALDLAKLYRSFGYRLLRLRRLYAAATTTGELRRSELLAVGVIELDNLVLSSLRVLTISSLSSARTATGARISVATLLMSEEEISAFMLSVLRVSQYQRLKFPKCISRRDEPTVRDPRDTEKVFLASGASNVGSLQNALALNTRLFSDLGTVRNFYAHRSQDTWRKVFDRAQAMGVYKVTHAADIVTARLPHRAETVFESWMNDADVFFEEATK